MMADSDMAKVPKEAENLFCWGVVFMKLRIKQKVLVTKMCLKFILKS
jgi:hypothetical protein